MLATLPGWTRTFDIGIRVQNPQGAYPVGSFLRVRTRLFSLMTQMSARESFVAFIVIRQPRSVSTVVNSRRTTASVSRASSDDAEAGWPTGSRTEMAAK
jgi:hypothetical protein